VDGGTSTSVAAAPDVEVRRVTADQIAWLAAVPCTVLAIALIVVLGEPLGALLEPSHHPKLWPYSYFDPRPEPTEHARYLLALLGPLLLAGAVLLGARRSPRRPAIVVAALTHLTQALLLGVAVFSVLAQRRIVYEGDYGGPLVRAFFTWPTIAVAIGLALALVVVLRVRPLLGALERAARETPRRRLLFGGAAVLMTVVWLLTVIQLESSTGKGNEAVTVNIAFWFGEAWGVLNGRTPLADFNPQYSHLWPYVGAVSMAVFGKTLGVYTVTMAAGTAAALTAVFAILRRVVRSSLLALLLFLPVLATGFFLERGPLEDRYTPANLLSMFPMRYGGPYLLAWLLARHLDGARPRRLALVFLAGGLVVLNNLEFGLPAFGAAVAAVLWTQPDLSLARLKRLAAVVAIGAGGALALVSALTLVRAGSLPDLGMLTFFSRLYGVTGFGMLPMHAAGFHLALYLTFAAAIGVATVRAVQRHEDVVLTGMLAWIGVFGLGIGGYFAGRSHPEVLIDLFSAWAFAMALLLVVAVRAIRARPARMPTLAELALLVGFGLAACSVAQTPTPWSQVERMADDGKRPYWDRPEAARFIARLTEPGEPVAILINPSHQVAYEAGVVNVSRFVSWYSMPLIDQMRTVLDDLRAAGGTKVFDSGTPGAGPVEDVMRERGFRPGATGRSLIVYVYRGPDARRR
jgi:hypothetical protein